MVAAAALLVATAIAAQTSTTARVGSEVAGYGDTDHVYVLTPSISGTVSSPTEGWSGGAKYLVDVVSAASVDIVSTASRRWTEVRQAGGVDAAYKPHDFGVGVSGSMSTESDYLSLAFGGSVVQDFDDKNWTLKAAYGYGHDTIGRSETPFSVFSHELDRHSASLSLTRVVNRSTIVTFIADASLERGDQSKPYRYVPMFRPDVAALITPGTAIGWINQHRNPERVLEQLPLSRDRGAGTIRLAHRFDTSTIRLDERFYADSWLMKASTTDLRFLLDGGRRWTYGPHARFHAQTGVNFWQRAYVSNGAGDIPAFRTGDRELGPLWSLTVGPGFKWWLGPVGDERKWGLSANIEGTWTTFLDAIYIHNRLAGLGLVALEGEL